jgi:hypothetical protein
MLMVTLKVTLCGKIAALRVLIVQILQIALFMLRTVI